MKKAPKIISSYYGLGDQIGFNINKDQIYNFITKNKLTIYADAIWKYNEKSRTWSIIWSK